MREELGFDGMVITDALEMRAVSATVGVEEGAVLASRRAPTRSASGTTCSRTTCGRFDPALVEAVRAGRLSEERLAEAAARVERAGRWTLEQSAATAPPPEVGLEAARRALHAEGAVELVRPALVVELVPEATIAAGPAGHTFGALLQGRRPGTEAKVVREPVELGGGDRQLVVVIRDAHRHAWEREIAASLPADAIVVDVGVPVWRPQGAGGYVATYGAGRANLLAAAERLSP